jgi:hypothetical protein
LWSITEEVDAHISQQKNPVGEISRQYHLLNEVCCISMEEQDRLEDWPDSLVSSMLAQDIHRVELSR